jgi:site-specific recombinase XerD
VLPAPLIAQLRAHLKQQAAERLVAGSAWLDWDLVFAMQTGAPIDSRSDWADWHDLLKEAGVREARVHDARDTAATLLLEQGLGVRVVQQILGHSQVSQTKRYTHVTTQLGRDAAQRMASPYWGRRQWTDDHEWGGWGTNPGPADYEPSPPPSETVHDSSEPS